VDDFDGDLWLSEQHNNNNARIAGDNACSNFNNNNVNNGNRFRAVFRHWSSPTSRYPGPVSRRIGRALSFVPDEVAVLVVGWQEVCLQNAEVLLVEMLA